jgi:hypothetical protein
MQASILQHTEHAACDIILQRSRNIQFQLELLPVSLCSASWATSERIATTPTTCPDIKRAYRVSAAHDAHQAEAARAQG